MEVEGARSLRAGKGLDGRLHTFVNPYSYRVLRKLRPDVLRGEAFLVHFDGISLALLARVCGGRTVQRESFDDTSLAPVVFSECVSHGLSVALIGSSPGIAASAADHLMRRYPALNVKFVSDGYFPEEMLSEVLARAAQCDVVICSMGTPHQEDLLLKLRAYAWKGTGYTCGGYLDQLVGSEGVGYYPPLMDKLNLRWLYRIWKEPRRLIPRYAIDYPVGLVAFVLDRVYFR